MHWVYLMLAIAFEVGGTISMKLSDGFSKLVPSILVFVLYAACLAMVTLAFEKLPVSVVYTMWGSIGTVAIVLIGLAVFDERLTGIQIGSVVLVIIGVIGLNLGRVEEEAHDRPRAPTADATPEAAGEARPVST